MLVYRYVLSLLSRLTKLAFWRLDTSSKKKRKEQFKTICLTRISGILPTKVREKEKGEKVATHT